MAPAAPAITYVVPQVFLGAPGAALYPTAPLADGANGPWTVRVRAHFVSPAAISGTFSVQGSWPGAGASASARVELPAGNSSATLDLAAADVDLWWPVGLGAQSRYSVAVAFAPAPVTDARLVGFRAFYLVTGNDADPARLAGVDGSDSFTLRWKVNGADVWSRGASLVPLEDLEARATEASARRLVRSAAAVGNTIRVWGGGVFQHEAFYDECDAAGLMVLHDMMYAAAVWEPCVQARAGGGGGGGDGSDCVFYHYPSNSTTTLDEIAHNIRRLSHHPSIVLWTGCNECENADWGAALVPTLVMSALVAEDASRPVWPACPSMGWSGGVDRLTGLPNGRQLATYAAPGRHATLSGAGVSAKRARPPVAAPVPAPVPAPAPATAVPAAALSASALECELFADSDIQGNCTSAPSTNASDCCAQCYAKGPDVCWASVYYQSACYFKPSRTDVVFTQAPGAVACWPSPRNGPPPPSATANHRESHGPYFEANGFATVSQPLGGALNPWPAGMPNELPAPTATGADAPAYFNSEFGFLAPPAFESLAPMLSPDAWGLHSGEMFFRDWPCDSQLVTYFNVSASFVARTGEAAFKAQLFLCSLAQLVNMKNFVEQRRAANFLGNILWQLNDIWPAVSWGTLEYGTPRRGNVVGGRWKPAHYALATLFADAIVACGGDGRCYVRNDGPLAGVTGSVSAALVHTLTGEVSPLALDFPVALPAGVGRIAWLCAAGGNVSDGAGCAPLAPALAAAGCSAGGDDCVLSVALTAPGGAALASNYLLLAAPGAIALPAAALVTAAAADAPNADGSTNVTVATSATALFVTLTTEAAGRFSANAFHVFGARGSLVVRFIPFEEGGSDPATLAATLRVEHLGEYLGASRSARRE